MTAIRRAVHIGLWLPKVFYSGVPAMIADFLGIANAAVGAPRFSFEFISRTSRSVSTSGISFKTTAVASKDVDALILIGPAGVETSHEPEVMLEDSRNTRSVIIKAQQSGKVIAAHCGAAYFLADCGVLNGKKATTSWWLREEVKNRFPLVNWDVNQMLVRDGQIYTCGGGYSGLELISALLSGFGFSKQVRLARNFMVLPPMRSAQTPYEMRLRSSRKPSTRFTEALDRIVDGRMHDINVAAIAECLDISLRTLSRKFEQELRTSPGRWLQAKRLERAKTLLKSTSLNVAEICESVGYADPASFTRLFSKEIGMAPGAFRKHVQ